MEFKGKKLLILAGAGPHCHMIETAKKMGVYTIVTDYLKDSPGKELADEAWMLNITDVDRIVEQCVKDKVDGVLSACIDPAQRPYQQICEKLGLPCFGNAEQFFKLTDKTAFKQFCRECGVDVIPEYTSYDVQQGKASFPLFVKPVDSRGSRGQTICNTPQEVESALKYAAFESSNGAYIIEQYMGGKPDFSMTYFVCGGNIHLVRTADRHLGRVEDGMNRQTIASISPSVYTPMLLESVHKKTEALVRKLGIQNGPVLMQGFVDGNTIKFYDPGLRFPGNEYQRMFAKATGINLMEICIAFALGENIASYSSILGDNIFDLCGKRIIQVMYNIAPGKVKQIRGIEQLLAREEILGIEQRHFVGSNVQKSGDIKQRACEIEALVVDQEDKIKEIIQFIQSTLEYIDENGRNMHISSIDPEEMAALYKFYRY